ncbi:MAG: ABC transporter ATP-binding protein [Candidatus Riflebacteria bacterium]|nr:ABC transporter ATP-binding protein [Candidatus Riflebacteria bacterium]
MKLTVRHLRKQFANCLAVDDLSFSIETGEITGFVGPNGAGKTTTMRILSTIEQCTGGRVELDGKSILEYPELARKHIGYVPDSLPSNSDMTVHEYLDFFARAYGLKTPQRQETVSQLEEFTNLVGIKEKYIDSLSKGMKQRVSIARALISNPDFILMDEPAAGLDPRARIELRELLKVLCEQGKGILISSHILSELSEICTATVIIEKGELLTSGKIEEVVKKSSSSKRVIQIKTLEHDEMLGKKLVLEPLVDKITSYGNIFEFEYDGSDEQAAELLAMLIKENYRIIAFGFKQQNLESVFMNITKGDVQ